MLTFWEHHLTRLAVLLEAGEGGVLLLDPPTTPDELAASTAAALGVAEDRVEIVRLTLGPADGAGHVTSSGSMTNEELATFSRILTSLAARSPPRW